ncbi:MAG: hypothetical protein ACYC36_02375 [Bellilinea sp.]
MFTGLRNDRPIERFEHSDLAEATNVDIDNSGGIHRRPGYTKVATGNFHSLWSDGSQGLVVANGMLNALSSTYSLAPLKTLADPTAPMSYSKINGLVYFSNGTDTGILDDGAVRSWGIEVPPTPAVSVGVGSLAAGDYQYTVTYMRDDGQESGAALAGVVSVPAGSGLSFALPVSSDPAVSLKNVYLSTPNGEVLYWALSVPNSQLMAAYTGDALELNLPLLTQFLGPAPAGQLAGYYRGRMYVAAGEYLYPSEPFAYELFDLRKFIAVDGRITMLGMMEDKERPGSSQGLESGIFLGTDRSCGILVGKDEFQYVPKTDYGAIEGAQVYVDGSLFADDSAGARQLPIWLTTQGICVGMPQMEIRNLTRTKFAIPASGTGAGLFQPGANKLILTSNY